MGTGQLQSDGPGAGSSQLFHKYSLSSSSSSSRSLQVSLREAEQLHALATVLAEAAQHNWLAALQLPHTHTHDSGSTSSSSIQRAYRRLAGLIHPDKCAHPSAASGFQALSRAHTAALQAARQAAAGGDGDGGDEGWGADDAGESLRIGVCGRQLRPLPVVRHSTCSPPPPKHTRSTPIAWAVGIGQLQDPRWIQGCSVMSTMCSCHKFRPV